MSTTMKSTRHAKKTSTKSDRLIVKPVKKITAKNRVPNMPEEVKIIKRFVGFHGKQKTSAQIMGLLDALQKAVIEKKIRKNSAFATEIDEIQDMLLAAYKHAEKAERDAAGQHAQIEISIDSKKLSRYREISEDYITLKSVAIIKRYISLDGKKQSKEKAQKLLSELKRYRSSVRPEEDPNWVYLGIFQTNLEKYISGIDKKLNIEYQALNGFTTAMAHGAFKLIRAGAASAKKASTWVKPIIVKAATKTASYAKKAAGKAKEGVKEAFNQAEKKVADRHEKQRKGLSGPDNLFKPIDAVKSEVPTFRLKGDIGKILGNMERNELAITLDGLQGSGKSHLAFIISNAFADEGMDVGIFELEMAANSKPVLYMRDKYISPNNRNKVQITDQAPDGVSSVAKYAEIFDVIVIDSWGKLHADKDMFDALRKSFPNTIFVVLFQKRTGKDIRGGNAPLFDAGINLEVIKADNNFINNYAVASKNRYGETGIKYNISEQRIME